MRTLHPTIAGGDSGELSFVACRLQIPHPPGYPLYTMLAHVFTWIAWGDIGWRVNLLSAVCDAGAAALLCRAVLGVTRDALAALVASLLFAFSPLVWTYATEAEVFALHNLFVALLLVLADRWNRDHDDRTALAVAFVTGLGLANHHTLVLFAAPLLAWMLASGGRRLVRPAMLARMAGCVAAGLLPYAYLPLAARGATTLSWGDPSSVQGFFDVLLRRDYGTFGLGGSGAVTLGSFVQHLASLAGSFARGSLFLGVLYAGAAVALSARAGDGEAVRTRRYVVLLVCAIACCAVTFAALANLSLDDPLLLQVTSRFWQQPELFAFALTGIGLALVRRRLERDGYSPRWTGSFAALAALLVPIQLASNFAGHDESDNRYVADYGKAILAALPPNALLLTFGDVISNSVRYEQACESYRPDVVVLDQEMMTKSWYIERARIEHPDLAFPGRAYFPGIPGDFDMKTFVERNLAARSVHVYPGIKRGDVAWSEQYSLVPDGVSLHVLPRTGIGDAATVAGVASPQALAAIRSMRLPEPRRYPPGTWEFVVLSDCRDLFGDRGKWLLDLALEREKDRDLFAAACDALREAAAQWQGEPPWYLLKNYGLAASRLAQWQPDARREAAAAWRIYLEQAPANEKDRAAITAALADLDR
ncbi:MAG TPA: DUF2723 domain-containing protein [Candidatus Binatia bacterium]